MNSLYEIFSPTKEFGNLHKNNPCNTQNLKQHSDSEAIEPLIWNKPIRHFIKWGIKEFKNRNAKIKQFGLTLL